MSDFNCEYNAPQYVDFERLEHEEHLQEDYFDFDHENVDTISENVDKLSSLGNNMVDQQISTFEKNNDLNDDISDNKGGNVSASNYRILPNLINSWGVNTMKNESGPKEIVSAHLAQRRLESPRRQELREEILRTAQTVANLPMVVSVPSPSKRLGTNLVKPRLLGCKDSVSQSTFKHQLSTTRRLAVERKKKAMTCVENMPSISSSSEKDPSSFKKTLRMHKSFKVTPRLAQPKPFNFDSNSRKRHHSQGSVGKGLQGSSNEIKFVSMAEKVMQFEHGSISRFHHSSRRRSKSVSSLCSRGRSSSPKPRQLTIALTPKLATKGRARSTDMISFDERERAELDVIRKKQFHARKVNEGVSQRPVPELKKAVPTVTKPFSFHETIGKSRTSVLEEMPSKTFRARPFPKSITMDKVSALPERLTKKLVEPVSPKFALKSRMNLRSMVKANKNKEEESAAWKAENAKKCKKNIPLSAHDGVPILMPNYSMKTTVMEPFSFDVRDSMNREKKLKHIDHILEQERNAANEFTAKALPDFNRPINLPLKEVILPTEHKPFKHLIQKRVETRLDKWKNEIKEEHQAERLAKEFQARPIAKEVSTPFVPVPSERSPLVPLNIHLHSEKRAVEREAFELQRSQHEAELQAQKLELMDRRKREEDQMLSEQREATQFHANPIRYYQGVETRSSTKPPTVPESPKFSLRFKK